MPCRLASALLLTLLFACGADDPETGTLELVVTADARAVFDDFAAFSGDERVRVRTAADPAAEVAAEQDGTVTLAVVADLDCTDCYRLEEAPGGVVVHGDEPLGVQYGVAHAMEAMGYRFFHPWRTRAPDVVERPALGDDAGVTFEPEMSVRGLHVHTLHPIEGYYDLWEPGEENLEGARRMVDWIVKNRGNRLEWVALDNIQGSEAAVERWRPHARAVIDYAHGRGVETGLNIQMFGESNLQRAFDLLDRSDVPDPEATIRARLAAVVPETGFDEIALSFGEFSSADPAAFVGTVDLVHDTLADLDPDLLMSAHIHVGNYDDTRITYMGEELLYYFLVKFADPDILPYVHTVMFYNLFEDAGLAYLHEEFDEHREYLLDRLRAGEPVVYYPESAYWVAFDNSVPQYFPLYVRSRWLDVDRIAQVAAEEGFEPLDGHVLFSTGWEWGYWQNDVATLRLNYRRPERWEALFEEMYAPWGDAGAEMAGAVVDLTRAQHTALIERRLAPYLAGRDAVIDVGEIMGIVSQPDRPSFLEVSEYDAAGQSAFRSDVIEPLAELGDATEAALERLRASGAPSGDRWYRELVDGMEVDLERARFAHAVWSAALAAAAGDPVDAFLEEAEVAAERGREPVMRRHADLHDPDPEALLGRNRNATLYQHGYLFYADNLCYWDRELAIARNALTGTDLREPSCVL